MSLEQAKIKQGIQSYDLGFSDGVAVGVILTTILAIIIGSYL